MQGDKTVTWKIHKAASCRNQIGLSPHRITKTPKNRVLYSLIHIAVKTSCLICSYIR